MISNSVGWLIRRLLVLTIASLSFGTTLAQIQCPPPDACGGWNDLGIHHMELNGDCRVDFRLYTRQCNGVWEFRYEIVGTAGTCNLLADFELYQYNFSALREFMDLEIIRRAVDPNYGYGMQIPLCSVNPNGQIVKMYSASCGIWVRCTWKLSDDDPESCDQGTNIPSHPPQSIDTWQWQGCGETCCKRTFTVCADGINPSTAPILIKSDVIARVGDCSLQSQYGSNPCYDGCTPP